MKTFEINKNDEGQRLNKFIEKVFFKVPKSLIYKLIRKKDIKVNSKKTRANYILIEGDFVEVYGLDNYFEEKNKFLYLKRFENFKLDVIFEDCNILVVNKEKGIKTHPNSKNKDSFIDAVIKYLIDKKDYIPQQENSFVPAFCGRLDTNTKGLLIVGKNSKALRELNELYRKEKIEKTYTCVVEGIMEKKTNSLVGYWTKNEDVNVSTITPFKRLNSKKVVTEYFLVNQLKNKAILKVKIKNGKSHQIRAHLASIGHPIVGDLKYGSTYKKKHGQLLSCVEVRFLECGSFFSYLGRKKIAIKG